MGPDRDRDRDRVRGSGGRKGMAAADGYLGSDGAGQ